MVGQIQRLQRTTGPAGDSHPSEFEYTIVAVTLLIIAPKNVVLALWTRALGGQAANLALILDAAGDLYGTTSNEGAGFGTVFKITQ